MPVTAINHRIKTGLFHPILMKILAAKQNRVNGKQRKKCNAGHELASWTACVSLIVLYFLSAILLLRCMDIEPNPGPDQDGFHSIMQMLDWKLAQMMNNFQVYTATIGKTMEENLIRLNHTLNELTSQIGSLQQRLQEDRDNIRDLQEDRDILSNRMDNLEQRMKTAELHSRKYNLKLFGVRELPRDSYTTEIDQIVDILNSCNNSHPWNPSDFERAYRAGDRHHRTDQFRPLIVQLHRWGDRMDILTNQSLRGALRQKGIRITADLTDWQQNEIKLHRQQGKLAYYRNGQLHVADRHPARSTQNYHQQYHQDTHLNFHNLNDWPQPQTARNSRVVGQPERGDRQEDNRRSAQKRGYRSRSFKSHNQRASYALNSQSQHHQRRYTEHDYKGTHENPEYITIPQTHRYQNMKTRPSQARTDHQTWNWDEEEYYRNDSIRPKTDSAPDPNMYRQTVAEQWSSEYYDEQDRSMYSWKWDWPQSSFPSTSQQPPLSSAQDTQDPPYHVAPGPHLYSKVVQADGKQSPCAVRTQDHSSEPLPAQQYSEDAEPEETDLPGMQVSDDCEACVIGGQNNCKSQGIPDSQSDNKEVNSHPDHTQRSSDRSIDASLTQDTDRCEDAVSEMPAEEAEVEPGNTLSPPAPARSPLDNPPSAADKNNQNESDVTNQGESPATQTCSKTGSQRQKTGCASRALRPRSVTQESRSRKQSEPKQSNIVDSFSRQQGKRSRSVSNKR